MLNCSSNKFLNWEALGRLVVYVAYSNNWLYSWQNNNLQKKYATKLLFTAKILQEAKHFTYPYLGQVTYKI